jgi:hypothetical protein
VPNPPVVAHQRGVYGWCRSRTRHVLRSEKLCKMASKNNKDRYTVRWRKRKREEPVAEE